MEARFLAIQHRINPLHVYCRFLDRGLSKRFSASICKSYEILIYSWITISIKTVIFFFRVLSTNIMIQEDVRKEKLSQ
jgi:hypothetical protein